MALPSGAMSTRRIVALAALGLLLLSGVAFGATTALRRSEHTRETLPRQATRLVINAQGGEVTVRAGVSSAVIVERDERWIVSRPGLERRYDGDTLELNADCAAVEVALRCGIDLDVLVPPSVKEVVVESDTADVSLRGLTGIVRVRTGSGEISAERLDPVVFTAESEGGKLDLDVVGTPTRIAAASDGGDVDVVVPFGTYRVDVDSDGTDEVVGLLRDDLAPQRIEARSDGGDVRVQAR